MTDWLQETVEELQRREADKRSRTNESEYWSAVANGISEALEVLEEADRKRAAENLESSDTDS